VHCDALSSRKQAGAAGARNDWTKGWDSRGNYLDNAGVFSDALSWREVRGMMGEC
jgi:hypothetical protein